MKRRNQSVGIFLVEDPFAIVGAKRLVEVDKRRDCRRRTAPSEASDMGHHNFRKHAPDGIGISSTAPVYFFQKRIRTNPPEP